MIFIALREIRRDFGRGIPRRMCGVHVCVLLCTLARGCRFSSNSLSWNVLPRNGVTHYWLYQDSPSELSLSNVFALKEKPYKSSYFSWSQLYQVRPRLPAIEGAVLLYAWPSTYSTYSRAEL